ncbi:MAG: hypothetical protein A3D94_11345 [Alphaproteobacteria bacterium RIFCSPHIGHO2_12_FULL_66_14]|nr:MAG: hypothetical protein A3D94_11345 [Alphaproteobacteria bacterium RIFCSPHIGHO2_12_FULL_66_14]
MADPVFLRRTDRGVTVELRAQPRARRTALECSAQGALKAAVTAPAEDGKANAAVVALLAAEWRLPRSAFDVLRGAAARDKVLTISGEPAALADRIVKWVREHD